MAWLVAAASAVRISEVGATPRFRPPWALSRSVYSVWVPVRTTSVNRPALVVREIATPSGITSAAVGAVSGMRYCCDQVAIMRAAAAAVPGLVRR